MPAGAKQKVVVTLVDLLQHHHRVGTVQRQIPSQFYLPRLPPGAPPPPTDVSMPWPSLQNRRKGILALLSARRQRVEQSVAGNLPAAAGHREREEEEEEAGVVVREVPRVEEEILVPEVVHTV